MLYINKVKNVKYAVVYSDQNGASHFKDSNIEFKATNLPHAPTAETSSPMQAAQIFFTKMPSGATTKLHPADKKQLFSVLAGQIEITVSDGEKRVFSQGDVLLIEDIVGKGHQGRIVGNKDFVAATVNLV